MHSQIAVFTTPIFNYIWQVSSLWHCRMEMKSIWHWEIRSWFLRIKTCGLDPWSHTAAACVERLCANHSSSQGENYPAYQNWLMLASSVDLWFKHWRLKDVDYLIWDNGFQGVYWFKLFKLLCSQILGLKWFTVVFLPWQINHSVCYNKL